MKVYIICWYNPYSDEDEWNIDRCFSSREKAEYYISHQECPEEYDIKEMEIE